MASGRALKLTVERRFVEVSSGLADFVDSESSDWLESRLILGRGVLRMAVNVGHN